MDFMPENEGRKLFEKSLVVAEKNSPVKAIQNRTEEVQSPVRKRPRIEDDEGKETGNDSSEQEVGIVNTTVY